MTTRSGEAYYWNVVNDAQQTGADADAASAMPAAHSWKTALDAHAEVYYYRTSTGEVQYEMPAEMEQQQQQQGVANAPKTKATPTAAAYAQVRGFSCYILTTTTQ